MAQLYPRIAAFMPPATQVAWLDADDAARDNLATWLILEFFRGLTYRGELQRRPIGGLPPLPESQLGASDYLSDSQLTILARYMAIRDVRPTHFTPDAVVEEMSRVFGDTPSLWSSRYGAMSEWIPRLAKGASRAGFLKSLVNQDVTIAVPPIAYLEERVAALKASEGHVSHYRTVPLSEAVTSLWVMWIDYGAPADNFCEAFGHNAVIASPTTIDRCQLRFSRPDGVVKACVLPTVPCLGSREIEAGVTLPSFVERVDLAGVFGVARIPSRFLTGVFTALDLGPLCLARTLLDEAMWQLIKITRIDLHGLAGVTTIGRSFLSQCSALVEVDLRPLSSLTKLGDGCLSRCISLTTVRGLPPNIASISSQMFADCPKLTTIEVNDPCAATVVGEDFAKGCTSLVSVSLEGLSKVSHIRGTPFLQVPKSTLQSPELRAWMRSVKHPSDPLSSEGDKEFDTFKLFV